MRIPFGQLKIVSKPYYPCNYFLFYLFISAKKLFDIFITITYFQDFLVVIIEKLKLTSQCAVILIRFCYVYG